jgi:hypothetical protein
VQPDGSNAKSCCVAAGAGCPDGDYDCCGFMSCVDGKCAAGGDGDPCLTGDDCVSKQCGTDGFCTSSAGMCGALKPVTAACNDSSECCNQSQCESLGGTLDPKNCCYPQGGPCGSNSECCGRMQCDTDITKTCICRKATESCLQDTDCCPDAPVCNTDSNTCVAGDTSLVKPGGPCMNNDQCLDTNSTVYGCEGTNGPSLTCCTWDLQIPCSQQTECCGASRCEQSSNDITFPGQIFQTTCCAPPGGDCKVDADCCGHTGYCDGTQKCQQWL